MAEGVLAALGPCWYCHVIFCYDPDTVASIWIDPLTQLPPDLGGDPERAQREPLCRACVAEIRQRRAAVGKDSHQWPVT